jgi:hypothetical protein
LSHRPCPHLPCPCAALSPSPSQGSSPLWHVPHVLPRLCQGLPRRSHHWRRACCCHSHLASACQSAHSTSHACHTASWTWCLCSCVNVDVDADGDMPELPLAMSSPLTFKDEGQDQEEEEDPLPLGLTTTKHKQKKLGLPHVCRVVVS